MRREERTATARVRRLALATVALFAAFALTSAPAWAAPPEAPQLTVQQAVPATSATFLGILQPAATEPAEPGEYRFLYKQGSECEGAGETLPLMSFGGVHEELPGEPVASLTANTEYTVCLSLTTPGGTTPSAPVHFTTALPPETPITKSPAVAVTATTATLEGTLNPGAPGNPGHYEFRYRPSSTECQGEGEAGTPEVAALGHKAEAAKTTATGLAPATQYTFCLLARNEAGETAVGNPVTFTTLPAGPTVESESASAVNATEATLEATVNPNNQKTTVSFEYATEEAKLGTGEATVLPAGELPAGSGGQPVSAATGAALTPGTTYFYRAVAENQQSKVEKAPVDGATQELTTAIAPEAPQATEANALTSTTATLHGILNPNAEGNAGNYEFLYNQSPSGCQGGSASTPEAMTGTQGQAAEAAIGAPAGEPGALLPNATYSFCLLARNEAGETATSPRVTFTTAAVKPSIAAETASAKNVTETTADLTAQVNPNGAPLTSCTFEYGTSTGSETPVPCAQSLAEIGSGRNPVPVSVHLTGLAASTSTYHWHLTVTNAAGSETTTDQTFTDAPAEGLPDGRQYEMVTPAQKDGALIGVGLAGSNVSSGWAPRIAEGGLDLIAPSIQCFANTESCTADRNQEGDPYEFARTPTQGWVTHPLAPPADLTPGANTLWAADAEQHAALFSVPSPPHEQDDFYVRGGDGSITHVGPVGEGLGNRGVTGIVATSGFSHILYFGKGLWSLGGETERELAVYEYAGTGSAHPLLVGVTGGPGSTSLISSCGTVLGGSSLSGEGSKRYGPLSSDGRTAYFTARCGPLASNEPINNELYARVDGELPDAHTVAISRPVPATCKEAECQAAPHGSGDFAGASADGSRVFFTSTQQLTDDASQSEGQAGVRCPESGVAGPGCNLYESLCSEPCGKPGEEPNGAGRELIDLSAGAKETGGPRVQGVMAISPDGSHVYFVARGVLTGEEENHNHEKAADGADNLYAYERDEAHPGGRLAYVATLPPADEDEFPQQLIVGKRHEFTEGIGVANVTPDGRFLVFLSHGALTPDDTRPVGPAQVYRYDSETGALVRISIGQHGFNDNGNAGTGDAGISIAENGYTLGVGPGRADPTMSHDGEYVFFESPVALTPGALDDVEVESEPQLGFAENVYEYHNGNVSLISDGRDTSSNSASPGESIITSTRLLGSDATGANVFFATNDQLTAQDTDTQRDYYDAHICTTESPCFTPSTPAVPCSEEGCRGAAPAAPAAQTPGSQSFSGAGNLAPPPPAPPVKPKPLTRAQKLATALKACHAKHNKHKRAVCEKQARKHFGKASKARKSASAKRSKR